MRTLNGNLRGVLLALLGFGLFSTHDAIIKHLGSDFTAFQIVFFRTLLGFPFVSILLMQDRTDGNLRPRHPWWISLRTACDIYSGTAAFYAFAVLPLAQVYALLFATPLLITLLAIPILGERVRLRRGLAVVVGLIGVLVVVRPGSAELNLGHLAALTSALAGATSSIISRKIGKDERSAVMLLYPMVGNFIAMGAVLPFVYVPLSGVSLAGLTLVALIAVVAGLINLVAYRLGEAAIVAPMQYSQILWAAILGYAFFGEEIDATTTLGVAIIIASGLYIVLRESTSNASATTPVLQARGRPDIGILSRVGNVLIRHRSPV